MRHGSMLRLQYDSVFWNSSSRMCPSSRLVLNQSCSHRTLKTLTYFFQLMRGHILGTICNHETHNTHCCQQGVTVSVSLCNTEHLQMVSHYSFQNLNKLLNWRGKRAGAPQIALTWLFEIISRAVSCVHEHLKCCQLLQPSKWCIPGTKIKAEP